MEELLTPEARSAPAAASHRIHGLLPAASWAPMLAFCLDQCFATFLPKRIEHGFWVDLTLKLRARSTYLSLAMVYAAVISCHMASLTSTALKSKLASFRSLISWVNSDWLSIYHHHMGLAWTMPTSRSCPSLPNQSGPGCDSNCWVWLRCSHCQTWSTQCLLQTSSSPTVKPGQAWDRHVVAWLGRWLHYIWPW